MIDTISYKLPKDNYVSVECEKKQIVIGNTFNHSMRHFTGWLHRYNGIYKKTAAFTITKEGKIYNHFEPKFHARYFNNLELDKKTIVILLENEGWLLNDQENNQFITWLGDIYNQEKPIFEKRWRGYDQWTPYTKEQLDSTIILSKILCEEFNIPLETFGHNTKVDNISDFSGIVYKSNIDRHFTDISPAWDCINFKNKLELKQ